jgi:adenosylhomocysteinase
MPYHLQNTQLRVLLKYTRQERNRSSLQGCRLVILEHVLPTTSEFLQHLTDAGTTIHSVIAKPYSINGRVLADLQGRGINLIRKSYDELEQTDVLEQLLLDAVAASIADHKQIIIVDVGGYFARILPLLPVEAAQVIAGVVEDTTFGHNRYLDAVLNIPVPVFSVARSALKEVEARSVGRDAVAAVEEALRSLGVSIVGRNALVIGYGMIGSNVAKALRNRDLNVAVYDKQDCKNLRAFIDGFQIDRKRELIKNADIIFAATATTALEWKEIEECKDNAILASVGSKDTEFDIRTLREQALSKEDISAAIKKYTIANSKALFVIKDGTAVNFLLSSMPVEMVDLVFSEILLCMLLLLKRQDDYPPGTLHTLAEGHLNAIADDWLRLINIA